MPGVFLYDGNNDNLFENYVAIAQRLSVYNVKDYVDILEYFVERWNVGKQTGLSEEGRRAQDYVCGLGQRLRKMEKRAQEKAMEAASVTPNFWGSR